MRNAVCDVLGVVLRAPPRAGRRAGRRTRATRRARRRRRAAHPLEPRERLALGQVAHGVEPGQHALVATQAGIVGGDGAGVDARVGVAEQRGLVAEAARLEGDVRVAGVERRAVQHRPVVHEVHAGVERRPGSARTAPPARNGAGTRRRRRRAGRGSGSARRGARPRRGSRPATGRR